MQIDTRTMTSGSGMPVTLYYPEGTTRALPSVVLMHERYGLVQHTGDLARRLADEGYCVATPDLFYYMENQDAIHSGAAKAAPSDPFILERLDEVVSVLSGEPVADSSKLGMIGVCQTGRYSMIYGAKRPLDACIVLYGGVSDWDQSERRPEHLRYQKELCKMIESLQFRGTAVLVTGAAAGIGFSCPHIQLLLDLQRSAS